MSAFEGPFSRRSLLRLAAGLGSFAYAERLLGQSAGENTARSDFAERLIIVYHPDGAFLEQWHPKARSGLIREWPESIAPLNLFEDQLLLFRNLNLLDGNGDGHDEGARCVLTGSRDAGKGSLDVHLSEEWKQPLLHVGVMANKAQGHSISFLPGGIEKLADDSPLAVYRRLFQGDLSDGSRPDEKALASALKELSIFSGVLEDGAEKRKIEQHIKQIQLLQKGNAQCGGYDAREYAFKEEWKWDDRSAPVILKMQFRNLLEAMHCGLSRVATVQFSRHTSPLKMDFDWLARWGGQYPMESHQASHNSGEIHAQQKKWINQQLCEFFRMLQLRPEPNPTKGGSMLDHSLVLVVTEISQGASHSRKDMPFYLVGGRGLKGYSPGRILDCGGASHTQLLAGISRMLGVEPNGAYAGDESLKGLFLS